MSGVARAPSAEQRLEPAALAARAATSSRDQAIVARNLADFPPTVMVRGVFFEGLSRVMAQTLSPATQAELARVAGSPAQPVAFRLYPHADFYRLYYVAARALYPNRPFPEALRLTAREFFPIFRNSMLGKTMTAFMGSDPETVLPLLAKAYNVSVTGNEHAVALDGGRKATWRCSVESVEWYDETFAGIVEGAAPPGATLKVKALTRSRDEGTHLDARRFEITW